MVSVPPLAQVRDKIAVWKPLCTGQIFSTAHTERRPVPDPTSDMPPPDPAAIEERVRAALRGLGIAYATIACQPDQADTAVFCNVFGISPEDSVNTILVASKATASQPQRFAACLVLATTRLDVNRAVRKQMGVRKASFASLDDSERVTGMISGGVTPFALPDDIAILIDGRIAGPRTVWLGGGSRSLKIGVAADDLQRLPNAAVVDGLAVDAG